jgi:hypothetical protein
MIASLDAASWFFQASHWATSRAEIASVHSGIETSISMSVPFARSFWAATALPRARLEILVGQIVMAANETLG